VLPLANLKATPWNIAVNAVMAGCRPEYMPVLIAAVEAFGEPAYQLKDIGSTISIKPFILVNGPIAKKLDINHGCSLMSPGRRANATIGRAMGLIIKNIGGARKGVEDMGICGNPGKYSQVTGENEEASPWEPLHVEHGLNKEDSAVTVSFPNSMSQIWPYSSDANGIMRGVTSNVIPGRKGPFGLIVLPTHAKVLAEQGWTKKGIAYHISQYARVQYDRDPGTYGPLLVPPPIEYMPTHPMDTMPILRDPNWIRVIVAGESTGTVVADGAMSILRDNPRVYSIQTGTPFWHRPLSLDRTLLMNSNGKTIDTFSHGNIRRDARPHKKVNVLQFIG